MNDTPQIPASSAWEELRDNLSGSFAARSSGLMSNTFIFQRDGLEIGRLAFKGRQGAKFVFGTLEANIERSSNGEYALSSENRQVLSAVPQASSLDALEITCGEGVYRAHISFFRNTARAFSTEGSETALLTGNATGRRYEVRMDKVEPAALPTAILLLYHTSTFRKRAFLA